MEFFPPDSSHLGLNFTFVPALVEIDLTFGEFKEIRTDKTSERSLELWTSLSSSDSEKGILKMHF
jgi:hypothetical protein